MAFCSKCGKELAEGAQFCANCGTPVGGAAVNDGTKRVQKFEGEIRKCPGCGAVLQSFQAVCPECGMELRGNANAVSSVKQFADKLMEIESMREQESLDTNNLLGMSMSMVFSKQNKADTAIISLIKTFPVPNTIEDIVEFMLLAENNLDVSVFGFAHYFSSIQSGKLYGAIRTEKEKANAWLSKMEQVYKKAQLSFSASPMFQNVKDLYEGKMKKVAMTKKIKKGIIIVIVAAFVAWMVWSIVYTSGN